MTSCEIKPTLSLDKQRKKQTKAEIDKNNNKTNNQEMFGVDQKVSCLKDNIRTKKI